MFNLEEAEIFRKNKGQAKVFGYILFTDSHSNIVKVMSDNTIWKGLDEDSEGWIIYSVKPIQGKYEIYGGGGPGGMGMLVQRWKEPSRNKNLLELFEIKDTSDLPCLVIFNIINESDIEKVIYKLKDDTYDNARNSLKEFITEVTEAITKIEAEYRNTEAVFRNVKGVVNSVATWHKIKNVTKLFLTLKGAI